MKLERINFGHLDKAVQTPRKENKGIVFQSNQISIEKNLQALGSYGKYIAFKGHDDTIALVNAGQTKTPVGPKLQALREELKRDKLDALIVSSCDDYLNETVDKKQSQRIYISNFSGSAGDAVVANDKAFIIVDSRYHEQADKEVDHNYYQVEKVGVDPDGNHIKEYPADRLVKVIADLAKDKPITVGFDPNTVSVSELERLQNQLKQKGVNIELKPTTENLVDKVRGGRPPGKVIAVREIPLELVGASTSEKLATLRLKLAESEIDAMAITNLVDIAYITNLRGKDIDYSAVFKSKAIVTQDKAIVFCKPEIIPSEIRAKLKGILEFKPEDNFKESLERIVAQSDKPLKIGCSSSDTNVATKNIVENISTGKVQLVEMDSNPVELMRSIKNDAEMSSMQDAFSRSDRAVTDVINWLNEQINAGKVITEKDLEDKVREEHFKHGANDLSFEIIPASGPNGAIIHYSEADPKKVIQKGELVLLDTGGYYSAGYATDLTRTWVAGGDKAEPTDKQKQIYSLVLKGAMRGITADLPPGADGAFIDNIVRTPIKEGGFNFGHGTGHGVGIVVHEAPPYITSGPYGKDPLKEGMIFSIEPGIYLPGWGGVRFENIVTVVKHPDPQKAKEGWHKIESLTYAPIDKNLIDPKILEPKDLELIEEFEKKSQIVLAQKD